MSRFVASATFKRLCERPGAIFVFGSNKQGIHGAGAAKEAHLHYGAKWNVGEGLTGRAYALPTKRTPWVNMSLEEVAQSIVTFLDFARNHEWYTFYVTPVGTGYAGFTDAQIAPLFVNAPDNCIFLKRWEPYFESNDHS